MICLPSYRYSGPDEADDRVHQQRLESASDGVRAGFERLLIDAVMRVGGKAGALARLEVHHVVADGPRASESAACWRFLEQLEIDAEAGVGRLGSGDRLKDEVNRRAAASIAAMLRRDVGEHARLRRDLVTLDQLGQHVEQADDRFDGVGRRVDADHGVAAAVKQAVEDRRADSRRVVRRDGWAAAESRAGPARPIVLRKRVTTRHLLATRMRSWLRISLLTAAAISGVSPGAKSLQFVRRSSRSAAASRETGRRSGRRSGCERCDIVRVDDESRDLVRLVRDDAAPRERGRAARRRARAARRHAPRRFGGDAGEHVAAAVGVALASKSFKLAEAVRLPSECPTVECGNEQADFAHAVGGLGSPKRQEHDRRTRRAQQTYT